jgi:sterol desaturase/sphingolipid hydroxylase (fatty acid hydroxylase superfamily)
MGLYVDLFSYHFCLFWVLCSCCFVGDLYLHKTHQKQQCWVKYRKAGTQALLVQLSVHFPLMMLLDWYQVRPFDCYNNWNWGWQFPVMFVMIDFLFYHLHRFCHINRYVYTHVHYLHHTWKSPVGVSALDTHHLEHLFVNLMPIFLSHMLVKLNYNGCILLTILATASSVRAHCGFKGFNRSHVLHHINQSVNFGTGFDTFDQLYQTFKN